MNVEDFIFTGPSKKSLIEQLVVSCDLRSIRIPASDRFAVYRQEMESFEYQLDGGEVRYGAPSNAHDDCVMSLALAVRQLRGRQDDGVARWYEMKNAQMRGEQVDWGQK